jgi:hypothetical protein
VLTPCSLDATVLNACAEYFHYCGTTWDQGLLERLLIDAADRPSFALQITLILLLTSRLVNYDSAWPLLRSCLRVLQDDCFDPFQIVRLRDCCNLEIENTTWPCDTAPNLLRLLIEAGAPVHEQWLGRNIISNFLRSDCIRWYGFQNGYQMLSILIGKGVDVNERCMYGPTPSMFARYSRKWKMWYHALKDNDTDIKDVVCAEGNGWLLGDNWQEVWVEYREPGWELVRNQIVAKRARQKRQIERPPTWSGDRDLVIDLILREPKVEAYDDGELIERPPWDRVNRDFPHKPLVETLTNSGKTSLIPTYNRNARYT